MATSGTISGSTSNQYIDARIVWSAAQNVSGNYSTITATLSYRKSSKSTERTGGTFTGNIYINGVATAVEIKTNLYTNDNWVEFGKATTRVNHNADGSKSITIKATGGMKGTTFTSTNLSASVSLDRIPRAATLTSAPNFNDEGNPVIKYSNPAGNAVSSLKACISLTGATDDIAYRDVSKTGDTYTFNLTSAERETLRKATTTANSRKVRFYLQTTIGESVYRKYLEKTLTIVNANPTVSPTVIDSNSTTTALTGDNTKFVKYYSKAQYTIGAQAKKNATLKSQSVKVGNKSSTAASGTINAVESGSFVFSATDSRGNKVSQTISRTLINYIKLTNNLNVNAPTTDGNLTFTVSGNYFNGSFGAQNNKLTVYYRYKAENGAFSNWINITPQTTITGNTYKAIVSLNGLDYQTTYTFEAMATDQLAGAYSGSKKVKTKPIFDWGADDFQFNVPVGLNWNGYSYDLLGLFRAMTTTYTPDCSVSVGDNYTSATATAHLTGCNLRIGISAVRKESLAAGNFTNETVAVIDVNHGGKLANLYRVSFNTSTSGGVATLDCQATKIDDNTVRLTINLCAAAQALTEFNAYFAMPCTIITKAYV